MHASKKNLGMFSNKCNYKNFYYKILIKNSMFAKYGLVFFSLKLRNNFLYIYGEIC